MGFIRFRAVCTVLLCALLAVLFWLPQRMLTKNAADWTAAMDRAEAALKVNDLATARAECAALTASFQAKESTLERFLNHDAVDAVLTSLMEAQALAEAADAPGALSAIVSARGGLEHLLCIERFTWNALL